jgi:hypothetical protein
VIKRVKKKKGMGRSLSNMVMIGLQLSYNFCIILTIFL